MVGPPLADPLFAAGDGHTQLSEEDRRGLRLNYITTRGELNEAEQANIARALTSMRPPGIAQILDDLYLREVHRRMFSEVWEWAGRYRTVDMNIGVPSYQIPAASRDLVEDAKRWIESAGERSDVLALRFHHRLVALHPFPNGNGRHGRAVANYFVQALGEDAFTWGAEAHMTAEDTRTEYILALREADAGYLRRLIRFART